jgi:hypothetical protein
MCSEVRKIGTNLDPCDDSRQCKNYIGHHICILVLPECIKLFSPGVLPTIFTSTRQNQGGLRTQRTSMVSIPTHCYTSLLRYSTQDCRPASRRVKVANGINSKIDRRRNARFSNKHKATLKKRNNND